MANDSSSSDGPSSSSAKGGDPVAVVNNELLGLGAAERTHRTVHLNEFFYDLGFQGNPRMLQSEAVILVPIRTGKETPVSSIKDCTSPASP